LSHEHYSDSPGFHDWTLTSVRHWGEHAKGTWTVRIADTAGGDTGTLESLKLELIGSTPEAHLTVARTDSRTLRVAVLAPAPGWSYALERSTNLTEWSTATNLCIGVDNQAVWLDTNTSPTPRFYRGRLLP
jgi:subtilisin-like proprotein convertase family protein